MGTDFAVLAATTVTSTGPTVVDGNLGVHPGTSVTGFPPGDVVNGSIHSADEDAAQGKSYAESLYVALSGRLVTRATPNLSGKDLGGMVLTPETYCFGSSAGLTGKLTLQGDGDFIFLIGSTLTTAERAAVVRTGSGMTIWLVGSSATLGTGTDFVGTIIAKESITLVTGCKVKGRLLALAGAVTLDSAHVSG
jgi:hypothetical protein